MTTAAVPAASNVEADLQGPDHDRCRHRPARPPQRDHRAEPRKLPSGGIEKATGCEPSEPGHPAGASPRMNSQPIAAETHQKPQLNP